jgi:hypothetical protein
LGRGYPCPIAYSITSAQCLHDVAWANFAITARKYLLLSLFQVQLAADIKRCTPDLAKLNVVIADQKLTLWVAHGGRSIAAAARLVK